jgi:hypothetical protein
MPACLQAAWTRSMAVQSLAQASTPPVSITHWCTPRRTTQSRWVRMSFRTFLKQPCWLATAPLLRVGGRHAVCWYYSRRGGVIGAQLGAGVCVRVGLGFRVVPW